MLSLAFSLVCVGFFLVFAEFFFPSVILGTLGFVFLFGSFFLFYEIFPFTLGFFLLLLGVLVGLAFTLYLGAKIFKRRVLLPEQKEEEKLTFFLLGKKGVVLSDLRPMGKVKIEGAIYSAVTDSYICRGKKIAVIEQIGERVKVEEVR